MEQKTIKVKNDDLKDFKTTLKGGERVCGGAWLFFWLKMITISGAVFYFARAIIG